MAEKRGSEYRGLETPKNQPVSQGKDDLPTEPPSDFRLAFRLLWVAVKMLMKGGFVDVRGWDALWEELNRLAQRVERLESGQAIVQREVRIITTEPPTEPPGNPFHPFQIIYNPALISLDVNYDTGAGMYVNVAQIGSKSP